MPRDKVIIDTERVPPPFPHLRTSHPVSPADPPGVDDVLAILLALASPELDIKALTITFGNTLVDSAYGNTLKIFAALVREFERDGESRGRYCNVNVGEGEGKIVLAKGAEGPIDGERDVAAYFHGADGLSNISTTHPHFTPPPDASHEFLQVEERPAWEVILDILRREEEGTVRLVALGPLSNLALALRQDPETFRRVKEVVWMGGALDVPGNTTPVAEFNCFADPYAAQEIVEAVNAGMFTMSMCPLDITTPHSISFDKLVHPSTTTTGDKSDPIPSPDKPSTSSDAQLTPLREFTSAMLLRVRGLMRGFNLPDALEMHDPMAVWYVISTVGYDARKGELPQGWVADMRVFNVERRGEVTRGMCVVDRRGTGEQSFLRTEGDHSSGANETATTTKSEEKSDATIKSAPRVVSKTPGSAVLEDMFLGRVFGSAGAW